MRYLLDTCTFIWCATDSPRLSATARRVVESEESTLLLSAVTALEIAIKWNLGLIQLSASPAIWVPMGREKLTAQALEVNEEAALRVSYLPRHHRDPFDRLLVAQALVHDCVILTPDPEIHAYPVRVTW